VLHFCTVIKTPAVGRLAVSRFSAAVLVLSVRSFQAARPTAIIDLIHSAESWKVAAGAIEHMPAPKT
jgi:hypothetical protein